MRIKSGVVLTSLSSALAASGRLDLAEHLGVVIG